MNEPPGSRLHIDEIVLTAAELGVVERETYLRNIAATDPGLAAEAQRRLVTAEALPDSFLQTSAAHRLGAAVEPERARPVTSLPPAARYELRDCLGSGSLGRVLKAFDRQLGRTVALKLLDHEDPQVLNLSLNEAPRQARVEHDHVVEIYDSGEYHGRPFIAMRYVAGGSLAEIGDSLPLEEKVRLLAQAAEGLHAAHCRGLLHRDVKPSNILVERTDEGELKALIADFGLASELDKDQEASGGMIAGSPQYIAPEHLVAASAGGSPVAVDRRADVYSFGVTLYRLLTGELPFVGRSTVQTLRQVVRHELPPPRQRAPDLPVELEAIILRCVAAKPEERYASARAVAADLRRYLDGETVEAYAAGLAYRWTRLILRNKLLAGIAVVVIGVLLLSTVAASAFARRADAARERAKRRHEQAEELIRLLVVDLHEELQALRRRIDILAAGEVVAESFATVPTEELGRAELLLRSRLHDQIGDLRVERGDRSGAAAESLALAEWLVEREPKDPERLLELGRTLYWVGLVAREQSDSGPAGDRCGDDLEVSSRSASKSPAKGDRQSESSSADGHLGSLPDVESERIRKVRQGDRSFRRRSPPRPRACSPLRSSAARGRNASPAKPLRISPGRLR